MISGQIMETLEEVFQAKQIPQALLAMVFVFVPAPDLSFERGVEILRQVWRIDDNRLRRTHFEETVNGAVSVRIDGARDVLRVLYPYPVIGATPEEQRNEWVNTLCEEMTVGETHVMTGTGDPYIYDSYHDRYYVILMIVYNRPLR